MPTFAKLSQAEVDELRRHRPQTQDLGEYLAYVDTLKAGDWGSVTLEEGDTQRTVERRLTTAAKQKGMTLKYKRAPEGQLLFEAA